MQTRTTLLWLVLIAAVGCGDDRVYVGDGKLVQVALTATTAPAIATKDGGLYIVETHAALPVRQPSATELADLRSGVQHYKGLPFARLPWVERGELELQVDFTVSNLDNAPHDIDVIINGANEFNEYVPGVVQQEDEAPLPMHSQWERRYTLAAKERKAVTVREEEFDEVAVDLATVVNGAPNSDEVVYFENKSGTDPRSMKYIPEVIPGLTALRLGLRSTEATPMLLEATVRVRDVGRKLAGTGQARLRLDPQPFAAVVPAS
jgi:hypothetical protein